MNRFASRLLALSLCFIAFASFAPSQTSSKIAGATAATSTAATGNLLDINTATLDQLKSLKGVGDAYSKRIINGRPYTAKSQLTTRGVLPQATYDGIKDKIIARAVKK